MMKIILHRLSKLNGSERTIEKTTAHLHCLHVIKGHYLGTISIDSSQTLYFRMYHLLLDEPLSLNVGAMDFTFTY